MLHPAQPAGGILLINELHGADWFHSRFSSHFCTANFAAPILNIVANSVTGRFGGRVTAAVVMLGMYIRVVGHGGRAVGGVLGGRQLS